MSAWYNEHDRYAAEWLRNLIAAGELPPGEVDERDIRDVRPVELVPYAQCHFFAGIGVWPRALHDAGWPDDRPVWTGSCPCQPFSQAGWGEGFADERHLWPAWHWLIGQSAPDCIFGEQVEGPDGLAWLDLVFSDLEARGYACGAAVFPAAGIGAPHIRSRTYWMAHAYADGLQGRLSGRADQERGVFDRSAGRDGATGGLADTDSEQLRVRNRSPDGAAGSDEGEAQQRQRLRTDGGSDSGAGGMADAMHTERWPLSINRDDGCDGADGGWEEAHGLARARNEVLRLGNADCTGREARVIEPMRAGTRSELSAQSGVLGRPSPVNGLWRGADWLFCRDGYWRPVEPGAFPLAHGAPARVGRLRACGNALVLPQATAFVEAVMGL
jgi:DNA (cytosine-5)-methyltransferase 1